MTSEGEFRAGLEEAVARAIYESVFVGSWDGAHGIERAQWLQAANAAVDEALAFRLPDQPEGPRVAVVAEQVGYYCGPGKHVHPALCPDDPPHMQWARGLHFDHDCESAAPVFTLFPATPETP